MKEDRIFELLIKRSLGKITLPEQVELSKIMKDNPDGFAEMRILSELNESKISIDSIEETMLQKSLAQLKIRIGDKIMVAKKRNNKRPNILWYAGAAAASVVIIIGIYLLYLASFDEGNQAQVSIIKTKKGSKSNIELPDGSLVWINDDTKLTYSKTFGESLREVNLEGEAYFEVVKDTKKPFIVHTKSVDIKVLGTIFNIKAYNDEKATIATLFRGSIDVILKNKNGGVIRLKPNERIIVQNSNDQNDNNHFKQKEEPQIELIAIKKEMADSIVKETQWLGNRLAFDQEGLAEIVAQLERWYNVKIIVKDSALLNRKISGVFENRSLQHIMEALKLAGNFEYIIQENQIVIFK